MNEFRVSSSADAVAVAVSMTGHLPSSEFVALPIGPGVAVTGVMIGQLLAAPEVEDREGLIEQVRHRLAEVEHVLVVVFGTAAQCDLVGEVVTGALGGRAVVFAFDAEKGMASKWVRAGVTVDETPVDLAGHPLVVAAMVDGGLRLQTRAEIRASFAPAQFGTERAGAVVEAATLAVHRLRPQDAQAAADHAWTQILAPYVQMYENGPLTVSEEHAAQLLAVAANVPVRDLLFVEFTADRGRALAEIWRQVGAMVPAFTGSAALILSGIGHWISCDAVPAREAITAGLEGDPTHRMGALIERCMDAGINPTIVWDQIRTAAVDGVRTAAQDRRE